MESRTVVRGKCAAEVVEPIDVAFENGQKRVSYEEVKEDIRNRIDRIEAGKATFYSNEEVFSSIRERYAL